MYFLTDMNASIDYILSELSSSFEENSNDDNAIKMEAYLKGQFKLYGIKAPLRKAILKPFYPEVKLLNRDDFKVLINKLWDEDHRDHQYAAMEFLQKNKKKLDANDVPFIERFIVTKSWWDSVDMLASHMVGHLFRSNMDLRNKWIEKWMLSDNIWLQRTCLIFQLKYHKETDLDLLKSLILELKPINEFFIQKGIGWALRDHSKEHPQVVMDFIKKNKIEGLAKREGLKWIKKHSIS